MKRPTKLYQLNKSGTKRPESDSRPIWTPDANETRVITKAEALGLSLHRCAKAFEGTPAYGLFDEEDRLPDPAIEYCAPLDRIEKWLDEHPDMDRYAQQCRQHLIDSIKGWRTIGETGTPEDVPPPPKASQSLADLRARLDRFIRQRQESSAPTDHVKG